MGEMISVGAIWKKDSATALAEKFVAGVGRE
jgi:hypothetical protein